MKHINNATTSTSAKISAIKRISPFWLLPFIAFCVGVILFYQLHKEQGEQITIYFSEGSGLVAEKTPIKYQGLQIGLVKKVSFTSDMQSVQVIANIYPEAATVLREDTKFWIVQPTATLAGVSGLDTLVSGNYITLSPGKGEEADTFIAEDRGPIAELNEGDLLIHLIADDLGSVELGSSIFFRKVPVGKVNNYSFTNEKKVAIDIIIYKQYAKFVKQNSRFWNISGIKVDANLNGISVNMDSVRAILQGAIAFDSPDDSPEAKNNSQFSLYSSIKAAKRGLNIDITLPSDTSGLKENETPVYFRDLQVGVLSEINYDEEDETELHSYKTTQAKLLVDPSLQHNLKTGTKIVLRDRPSLAEITNITQFLQGKYFEIVEGSGDPSLTFNVTKQSELLVQQPGVLILTLTAPQTYNIEEGQPVTYNGMKIGEIVSRHVDINRTAFKIAILATYRHLINADTRFIAASNVNLELNSDGIQMNVTSPRRWLQGGISVLLQSDKKTAPLETYPLYENSSNALAGITSNDINPTIVLTTKELPDISQNSLVLYRRFPVGKILNITPTKQGFAIDVFINQQYRHLFTKQSRFWAESAVQVNMSLQGVDIKAAPVARLLKGAISFDNIAQGGLQTILYPDQTSALAAGQQIQLITNDATNLNTGLPLRYLGVTIGSIQNIKLDDKKQQVIADALIIGDYFRKLSKQGSRFTLITPQISADGVQNLDALFKPYIDVSFGNGTKQTQFTLTQNVDSNKYRNGFPLVVETENAASLSVGAPVLYRGVEVGEISNIQLNTTADRVFVDLKIGQQYKHLVRQNSEFWLASGYSLDVGWRGVNLETGTAQQLLRGGIAFSTPSGKVVQPIAKPYQHFLLQTKKPVESKTWNQGSAAE
ncbi:MlaD family protein [Gallibacterium trehalosifermentans]|uniref:MlaD family protein n=1 Tax=Gallibacterium trehalosifermentans TaxID=516935 RepID=A0ABV6GZS7_9PAST